MTNISQPLKLKPDRPVEALPDDFPADLAAAIFEGMRKLCAKLKNMQ